MSTRGAIARLTGVTPPRFRGRYHHWDSYPTGLGHTLWTLYHGHFGRDLRALLHVLLDEHPAGWSTLNGADFSLRPGFTELANRGTEEEDKARGIAPECYCHGDRAEEAWEVTQANAAGSGCEWAYAFAPGHDPQHDVMLILSSYRPSGQKMIGFFGQGDPDSIWATVGVVALSGAEPDWEQFEQAQPLDPLASAENRPECVVGKLLISPDEGRPGIYAVRAPQGPLHYASVEIEGDGSEQFYCTCSPEEEAPSPNSEHAYALRSYLEEKRQRTRERRGRGLQYSGCRLDQETGGNPVVFVWEGGVPSILLAHQSQRLFNHSPAGFEWGYEGSGPAQLALAILLDHSGDESKTLKHHQAFKREVIAKLTRDDNGWSLSSEVIDLFWKSHVLASA